MQIADPFLKVMFKGQLEVLLENIIKTTKIIFEKYLMNLN
jgi:hypothetical protein